MILGIDEVGRGPWAGPLVVGAVVLGGAEIDGLTDSKKLSKKRREVLAEEIYQKAAGFGLGWVHAEELDRVGLSEALRLATVRAVSQVNSPYHEIIIDGTINLLAGTSKGAYVTTMKKADLLVPSVSAASIVAKVARDIYMEEQSELYPEYGFEKHVGYGTAVHRAAIEAYGVTPLHRLSFAPLQKYRQVGQETSTVGEAPADNRPIITTKKIGDAAEDVAAEYLQRAGHQILERNWKTKFCEIDIVSLYENVVYFTEVKYRRQPNQGGGVAAITPAKLRKMKFAAGYFGVVHHLTDSDLRLVAMPMSGEPPQVDDYLEIT